MDNVVAVVTGTGQFPVDMLRYDSCWPASEVDSGIIASTLCSYGSWRVHVRRRPLEKKKNPIEYWTKARWESFGVKIETCDGSFIVDTPSFFKKSA